MAQYTSITDEELVRLRKRDVKNAEKRIDILLRICYNSIIVIITIIY